MSLHSIRMAPLLVAACALGPAGAKAAEPRTLNPISDAYPAVSPDGKTIVFQSTRLGRRALFKADADGKNLRVFLGTGSNPAAASA